MSLIDELGLTEAQKAQLHSELLGNIKTAPPEVVELVAVAPKVDDEWVFTNTSGGDLMLPDLGVLSGDKKSFTPEVLPVGSSKDLREYYSSKELKACRTIKRALETGLLTRGRVSQPVKNELSQLAAANPNGTFEDPSSGKGEYDKKLAELERKDAEEDQRTRKGYQPGTDARR